MNKNTRVRHVTSGFRMTFGDVEEGIAACALAWVTRGETFRQLTEAEAIAARNVRAGMLEPFAYAEVRGVVVSGLQDIATQRQLARVAIHFSGSIAAPRERDKLSAAGDVWGAGLRRMRRAQFKAALAEARQ